ncbi:MAG TPA: sugar phosphate isomerase/epimerase family protein [Sedimentisphaerales bacterium]|nr:sugar phosphate isomerase/epimerase family protein [Sedimentisphaerales bacterium]
MERRNFLKRTAAAGLGISLMGRSGLAMQAKGGAKLRKALQIGMLPNNLSDADKFKLAKKCGYEGIEGNPMADLDAAKELGKLARDAGTPIHSIVYGGWGAPFSDPNPDVIEKGLAGMEIALRSAKALGASAVLLVPAIVKEDVGYGDAYKRSQEHIRKLLPLAKELGVIIAVENVWNKFLLSPLEFARYVDEFDSPWLKAYFDVGNVILFGYAQDWIRTLGKRIVKIHLKDFKREGNQWKNLLDGDVNWPEVREALEGIQYDGFLTPELGGGDEAYLTDLSGRIDKIIAMK